MSFGKTVSLYEKIRSQILKILRPAIYLKTYHLYEKNFGIEVECNLPEGFNFFVISTVEDYRDVIHSGYDFTGYPSDEDIEAALRTGACLISIFKEKQLAHTTWLAFDRGQAVYDSIFSASSIWCAGDAFVGPCNTYEPFRGLGLYPSALIFSCDYLSHKGARRCFINTKKTNLASIRGIRKAGFHFKKTVRVARIIGRKMIFFEGGGHECLREDIH